MTEDETEKFVRSRLTEQLKSFMMEVETVIQDKIHDSISVDELKDNETFSRETALYWTHRMLVEVIAEDYGPKAVAAMFDSIYFQISGQHCGPEDFREKAKPYNE